MGDEGVQAGRGRGRAAEAQPAAAQAGNRGQRARRGGVRARAGRCRAPTGVCPLTQHQQQVGEDGADEGGGHNQVEPLGQCRDGQDAGKRKAGGRGGGEGRRRGGGEGGEG
jgi:hypothetical protein